MKRAVLYLRVSTAEQVEGTSLETQERACCEHCTRTDVEIVDKFIDKGESAKTADRPEFQRMVRFCSDAKNRIDHVVVYRIDRLARNNHDFAVYGGLLAKYNVTLQSATEPISDDPTGRFMQTILSAIAELDNDIRGQRAKDGMMRVAEKGGWAFKAPLGYVNARDQEGLPILLEHPTQGPMIKHVFDLALKGIHTLSEIQTTMNNRGWKTVYGSKLYVQLVHKILTKPIYCGRITGKLVGGTTIKARFMGIVDETTYDRVQQILSGSGHAAIPHTRNNVEFPLRKFVKCKTCGWPLTGSFSTGRNGNKHPYYHCRNKACLAVNTRKGVMEEDFRNLLAQVSLFTVPRLALFKDMVLTHWQLRHAEAITDKARQQKRAEEMETMQRKLLDKLLAGVLSDAVYQAKTAELSAEIAICRAQSNDASEDEVDIEAVMAVADSVFRNTAMLWERLSIADRQRFQLLLFPDGLTYDEKDKFGTTLSSSFINVLQQESGEFSSLARHPSNSWNRIVGWLRLLEAFGKHIKVA